MTLPRHFGIKNYNCCCGTKCFETCETLTFTGDSQITTGQVAGGNENNSLAANFPNTDPNGLPFLATMTMSNQAKAAGWWLADDTSNAAERRMTDVFVVRPACETVQYRIRKAGVGAAWFSFAADGDPANSSAPVALGITGVQFSSVLVPTQDCAFFRIWEADSVNVLRAGIQQSVDGGTTWTDIVLYSTACAPTPEDFPVWVCDGSSCTNATYGTRAQTAVESAGTEVPCP